LPYANRARFFFASEPGEFIGQGKTEEILSEDAISFTARALERNSVNFMIECEKGYWRAEFAAPRDQRLRVGTYRGALRCGSQAVDKPGLDVSGNHRGSNRLFGEFVIHRIRFSRTGQLVLFDAGFTLHSEQRNAPMLAGNIYYFQAPSKNGNGT
jgi:hypothetical protein